MRRLRSAWADDSGIAIGAILFVVALLAILAIAITAGSSTFSSSSSQEANRTNASSIMSIGQNLKTGMDRIVSLGTPLANVVIDQSNTVNAVDLFSPNGGGLISPSVALASDPTTDTWIYTWADVTNIGTANLERIAALHVSQGVCDQINIMLNNGATPTGAALGNISNSTNFSAWPAGLAAKMSGCLNNSDPAANTYYFYQVIGVQ